VLGRSLEALITSAEDRQKLWRDAYTSVEHLMLAADEDPHFGSDLLRRHNVTREAMEKAIKDIRGSNRVSGALSFLSVRVHACTCIPVAAQPPEQHEQPTLGIT
jgi:ATP-dependent Clp protease ATP-binding subunit ClpA